MRIPDRFEDASHGGFFFTEHDHETLIHRSRSFTDDAPSGYVVAYLCHGSRRLPPVTRLSALIEALSEQQQTE